jgi:hypothetical protein
MEKYCNNYENNLLWKRFLNRSFNTFDMRKKLPKAAFVFIAALSLGFVVAGPVAVAQSTNNIIVNGDFATGDLNGWTSFIADWEGVTANFSVVNAEAVVSGITNVGSTVWHVQMNQVLTEGQINQLSVDSTYKITFDARSPVAGRPLRLFFGEDGGGFASQNISEVTLTTEMQTYEAVFTLTAKYPAMKLGFEMGTSTADVIIDNVTLSVTDVGETGGGGGIRFPITFEDTELDYQLADFGGNASEIVQDPTDPSNRVVRSVKAADAAGWAGTTVGSVSGFAAPIPFSPGNTTITVRVWSPTSDTPVRMKVEKVGDPTISVETEVRTTTAGAWETLSFDFSRQATGTAAINFESTYTMASIFFNFGTEGAAAGVQTYYWDDMDFSGENAVTGLEFPITFDNPDLDYGLVDFGGNVSEIVADPTDAGNRVVRSVKTNSAELWAGTTVGSPGGFAAPIPFSEGNTTLSVRVWSPTANTPVRLKVEDAANAAISVETEVMTTVANEWETLEFNLSNHIEGTPAIVFTSRYNVASIFFNFGTTGAAAGEQTYYWDDLNFTGDPNGGNGGGYTNPDGLPLPVTFNDPDVDYDLADFGGNVSEIVADPTNAENRVVRSVKTAGAATWAGTTVAATKGFATSIPFSPGNTKMSVRVWSPAANTPVRIKVEKLGDPTISVETETLTTVAGEWQTLVFDFANEATGTAAINFASIYTMASIFFNFGTEGSAAGEQTYFWDDLAFGDGEPTSIDNISTLPTGVTLSQNYPNPFNPTTNIQFELPENTQVRLEVFNMVGQLVATLIDDFRSAGSHEVSFDAATFSSGIYLYRLQAGNTVMMRKMTLLK